MSQTDQERDVAVLRWPAEADARERLMKANLPRLWLVEEGAAPPQGLDDLEDWMRTPFSSVELTARAETLRTRVIGLSDVPVLDEDGLLRHRGRWVAIPDAQIPVVALLLDRLGKLVRIEDLVATYAAAGGTTTKRSMNMLIGRLRTRIAELGLSLHVVRRRGVILDVHRF